MANSDIHQNIPDEFEQDVAEIEAELNSHPAKRWLFFSESAYWFAVAWVALEKSKEHVIFPANGKAQHWSELTGAFDSIISDQPNSDIQLDRREKKVWAQVRIPPIQKNVKMTFYTSGSTGEPKPVHRCLFEMDKEILALESLWHKNLDSCTIISSVPHYHLYGFLFSVLWPLRTGRQWRSKRIEYPEELLGFQDTGDFVFVSSPAFLKRWNQVMSLVQIPQNLKKIFSSGSALDEATRNSILGKSVTEVYGSTETGGIGYRDSGQVAWRALPGVNWKIDSEGSLWVQSPWISQDDWKESGDEARASDHHQFELKGRKDRVVKVEEKRVSLKAVEARMKMRPEILECRVLPMEIRRRQILGVAMVLTDQGREKLIQMGRKELIKMWSDHILSVFDTAAVPKRWRILESWPVNELGKTKSGELLMLLKEPI